jgi:hypothetical protein
MIEEVRASIPILPAFIFIFWPASSKPMLFTSDKFNADEKVILPFPVFSKYNPEKEVGSAVVLAMFVSIPCKLERQVAIASKVTGKPTPGVGGFAQSGITASTSLNQPFEIVEVALQTSGEVLTKDSDAAGKDAVCDSAPKPVDVP